MRRLVVSLTVLASFVTVCWAQAAKDSEKAAATRELLKTKISVDYSESLLQDVVKDLSERVKEASKKEFLTKIDTNSGASVNSKVTFKAKDKTVEEILKDMGKKEGLGYVVVSGKYKTLGVKYDGYLMITKGMEQGYLEKPK